MRGGKIRLFVLTDFSSPSTPDSTNPFVSQVYDVGEMRLQFERRISDHHTPVV